METVYILRYRTSADWEQLHTETHKTLKGALESAYGLSIGDIGISIGDISINWERISHNEIEEELIKLEYYNENNPY